MASWPERIFVPPVTYVTARRAELPHCPAYSSRFHHMGGSGRERKMTKKLTSIFEQLAKLLAIY